MVAIVSYTLIKLIPEVLNELIFYLSFEFPLGILRPVLLFYHHYNPHAAHSKCETSLCLTFVSLALDRCVGNLYCEPSI